MVEVVLGLDDHTGEKGVFQREKIGGKGSRQLRDVLNVERGPSCAHPGPGDWDFTVQYKN